jgi:LysM repeat protein
MKALRDLTFGLLSAIASGVIVLGALSLALIEGTPLQPTIDSSSITSIPQARTQAQQLVIGTITPSTPAVITSAPAPALPTACPSPTGWELYTIQPGDSVQQLAEKHDITPDTLRDANCLGSDVLLPTYTLYLPALPPTSTPSISPATVTPIPCGPPWGWVTRIVRYGDTLFKLSLSYGVSVPQIQFANCMGTSTYIRAGQSLYLPNVIPLRTAVPTKTFTVTATATLFTPSQTSISLTLTRTATQTYTFTPTFTPTITATPTNTPTYTITPSYTPTYTPTPTPTMTPSFTPIPTETETPTEPASEEP